MADPRTPMVRVIKKAAPPERISRGARIELRKHDLALAQTMFEYVDADRERLARFLPWVPQVRSVEDERSYILSTHEAWEARIGFDFGVFTTPPTTPRATPQTASEAGSHTGSRYLGNIGVHTISWAHQRCEIGYWILGEFEGQGYMSDAVRLMERELFLIGFNRIEIRCSSLNERSAGVPRRLGYTHEGTLRQNSIERDAFRNTLIFSKLRTDTLSEGTPT